MAAADAALARIARRAGVVFLSAPLKTPHPFFQQPNPARALALHLEHVIEQSGVKWTFLRPGMFAANSLDFWGPQVRAGSTVRWPYLNAPTAPIDERDIAAVGVRALTEAGHDGMEYVLTGPQSLTQHEQIMTIGQVIGRTLTIEELSREEARHAWSATMPAAVADMLMDAWAAAMGQPAYVTSTVREIDGKTSACVRRLDKGQRLGVYALDQMRRARRWNPSPLASSADSQNEWSIHAAMVSNRRNGCDSLPCHSASPGGATSGPSGSSRSDDHR